MQRPRAAVQNAQPPCKLQLNDYNFLLPAASLMARSTSLALPIDGWRIGLTRPSPLSLSVPYIFPFGIPIPTPSPSSHYYTCLLILIPYGALMNNGESWGLGVTGRAQYRRTCFFSFLSFFSSGLDQPRGGIGGEMLLSCFHLTMKNPLLQPRSASLHGSTRR